MDGCYLRECSVNVEGSLYVVVSLPWAAVATLRSVPRYRNAHENAGHGIPGGDDEIQDAYADRLACARQVLRLSPSYHNPNRSEDDQERVEHSSDSLAYM